jgi:hypothetical protein
VPDEREINGPRHGSPGRVERIAAKGLVWLAWAWKAFKLAVHAMEATLPSLLT